MSTNTDFATIEDTSHGITLRLSGRWLIGDISHADRAVRHLLQNNPNIQFVEASGLTALDTAGAYLLDVIQKTLLNNIKIKEIPEQFKALLDIVTSEFSQTIPTPTIEPESWIYKIGKNTVTLLFQTSAAVGFLGELFTQLFDALLRPMQLQWRSIANEVDVGGYRALPIIAVMMCLIGVVVAYQLGVQLQLYGANVYIVDLSGVSILREFAPLICAVIIAGRTSTSFAALLGTMKVNEEIDALETMGLSPMQRLVLPRVIALFVALPLLVVWGDIFGVFGSMVMAKNMAGISFSAFLERFQQEVAIKHLYLGLVKTPVFALIIAGIGCFQGFQASGSAQSVGERTTKAAVQAIFLIILADGLFSILFNWMDV